MLVERGAACHLETLARSFRVVIVNGPRQSGKTTLLRQFHEAHGGVFASLDTPTTLELARSDPTAFVAAGATPRIIDEVQRGGDPLVLALKYHVDQDETKGQFILSGSTRFLTVPTLSESLAGRAAFVDLWPFAMAERVGAPGDFCERLFDGTASSLDDGVSTWDRADYLALVCAGGYPEVVAHQSGSTRYAWFDGYLRTVAQRDIDSFTTIQHAEVMPRLLSLLAARAGSTAVLSDLAQGAEIAQETVRNYLSYLDTVFLVSRVSAWGTNLSAKAVKSPKMYVADPGLAAYLLAVDETALAELGHPALGGLVETLVHSELTKLIAMSGMRVSVRYFRDRNGREVDLVLERRNGQLVGIEVKASSTVTRTDFRHLAWLRDRLGDRFAGGYVLSLGRESGSFGDRLAALPLSAMWRHRPLGG